MPTTKTPSEQLPANETTTAYPCDSCGRRFDTRRAATQHRRVAHGGASGFGRPSPAVRKEGEPPIRRVEFNVPDDPRYGQETGLDVEVVGIPVSVRYGALPGSFFAEDEVTGFLLVLPAGSWAAANATKTIAESGLTAEDTTEPESPLVEVTGGGDVPVRSFHDGAVLKIGGQGYRVHDGKLRRGGGRNPVEIEEGERFRVGETTYTAKSDGGVLGGLLAEVKPVADGGEE